jgi:hypothetical protein
VISPGGSAIGDASVRCHRRHARLRTCDERSRSRESMLVANPPNGGRTVEIGELPPHGLTCGQARRACYSQSGRMSEIGFSRFEPSIASARQILRTNVVLDGWLIAGPTPRAVNVIARHRITRPGDNHLSDSPAASFSSWVLPSRSSWSADRYPERSQNPRALCRRQASSGDLNRIR